MTSEEALSELCAAFRCYSFPPVTFDFRENPDGPDPAKRAVESCVHEDMQAVEQYIRGLLRSSNRVNVRDGLSNVVYWGHARRPAKFQKKMVDVFRNHVTDDKLDKFMELIPSIVDAPQDAGDHLLAVSNLGMPHFTKAAFTTKVLMFLNPCSFPVLDLSIAKAFSKQPEFPPLHGLIFDKAGIPLGIPKKTAENPICYGKFADWTQKTAMRANEALGLSGSGTPMRAVDVERALFTLSDWWKRKRALTLLEKLSYAD